MSTTNGQPHVIVSTLKAQRHVTVCPQTACCANLLPNVCSILQCVWQKSSASHPHVSSSVKIDCLYQVHYLLSAERTLPTENPYSCHSSPSLMRRSWTERDVSPSSGWCPASISGWLEMQTALRGLFRFINSSALLHTAKLCKTCYCNLKPGVLLNTVAVVAVWGHPGGSVSVDITAEVLLTIALHSLHVKITIHHYV